MSPKNIVVIDTAALKNPIFKIILAVQPYYSKLKYTLTQQYLAQIVNFKSNSSFNLNSVITFRYNLQLLLH